MEIKEKKKPSKKKEDSEVPVAQMGERAPEAKRAEKAEPAFDAFGIDAALGAEPKSKSKSKKDIQPIDPSLKVELKLAVAGKRIIKAIEKKCDIASMRLKNFFVRQWATKFVHTGQVPSSVQYKDGDTSIDFVPTKRIHLKSESIEALTAIGVPIRQYLEVTDVSLDFQVLKDYGFATAAQEALRNIPGMTEEILKKIVKPNVKPKESLYTDLAKIAKESLGGNPSDEELVDRMIQVVQLVNPVSQIRGEQDSDSLGDAIEYVAATEIEATPDEEAKYSKKKQWNND